MNKYTAEYFINKFEQIPDAKWTVHVYYNPMEKSYCALGHCGCTAKKATNEGIALNRLFWKNTPFTVPDVNDGRSSLACELGDTPKERVINALALIAAGVPLYG